MTKILRPLPLPLGVPGQLWLSAMPGRFEPMTAFLAAAAQVDATGIVCLTNDTEIVTRSPDYALARQFGTLPLPIQNYPIPNYGLPQDREAFASLILSLSADLYQGSRLILHCAAGIGRCRVALKSALPQSVWRNGSILARNNSGPARQSSMPSVSAQTPFAAQVTNPPVWPRSCDNLS